MRTLLTLFLRIFTAYIGPNRFHRKRIRLMADIDARLVPQNFDNPERVRKPDVQLNSQTDDFVARFGVTKGAAFCHSKRLRNCLGQLKLVSSDKTDTGIHRFPE